MICHFEVEEKTCHDKEPVRYLASQAVRLAGWGRVMYGSVQLLCHIFRS
jgi:hypothetical protein